MPGLGSKYPVDIETVSRPKEEYNTDEYYASDLPVAPAVVVNGELAVEAADIPRERLEGIICRHLEIEPPEPAEKRGIINRLLKK